VDLVSSKINFAMELVKADQAPRLLWGATWGIVSPGVRMPKFAVYFIPAESDELYRLGSSVVGYDVRKRAAAPLPEALRQIPGFTEQWIARASPYGFHLTIGDAIEFDIGRIARIEEEIADLLGCFDPANELTLRRCQESFVTFWGPAVVLRYDPNDALKLLHAVIAARVHPLGSGSGYLRRYLEDPDTEAAWPHRARRILKFYSPTIFDSYSPHFTVLNPHDGESSDRLAQFFTEAFAGFEEIVLRSICLLVQPADGENWRIYREFPLGQLR
jgi:hypothetical protein